MERNSRRAINTRLVAAGQSAQAFHRTASPSRHDPHPSEVLFSSASFFELHLLGRFHLEACHPAKPPPRRRPAVARQRTSGSLVSRLRNRSADSRRPLRRDVNGRRRATTRRRMRRAKNSALSPRVPPPTPRPTIFSTTTPARRVLLFLREVRHLSLSFASTMATHNRP